MKAWPYFIALLFTVLPAGAWLNNQTADLILGESPLNTRIIRAKDMALDGTTGKLFVADSSAGAVLRYSSTAMLLTGAPPEAVFGKPAMSAAHNVALSRTNLVNPNGMTVDSSGTLWVADYNRILRWDNASSRTSGAPADGVLGGADYVSVYAAGDAKRLGFSMRLVTDDAGNLYVSCADRHSVMRFNAAASKANGAAADALFGQLSFTNTSAGLSTTRVNAPGDMVILGAALYIHDTGNRRILRLNDAATRASGAAFDAQAGQTSFFANDNTTLSGGSAMDINAAGKLYVATADAKIRAWTGVDSLSGILPAAAFVSGSFASQAVESLLCDAGNRVWVGAAAPDLTYPSSVPVRRLENLPALTPASTLGGIPAISLSEPSHVAVDPVSGKVFLTLVHAVHRYASVENLASHAPPEAIFYGVSYPRGLCMDNAGRLYVADTGHSRVLRWDNAATAPSLTTFTAAIGHQHAIYPPPQPYNETTLIEPVAVSIDSSGALWVLDYALARALRFDMAHLRSGDVPADGMLGKTDFADPWTNGYPGRYYRPRHLQVDASGTLWVMDVGGVHEASGGTGNEYRLFRYDQPNSKAIGAMPDATIKFLLSGPIGIPGSFAVTADQTLWVSSSDPAAPYIHAFPGAASVTSGTSAAFQIGSGVPGRGTSDLGGAAGPLSADLSGNLWVADPVNRRVLRFSASPTPPPSPGQNISVTKNSAGFHLGFSAEPGALYLLETSTNLQAWSPVAIMQAQTTRETLTDAAPSGNRRFYRAARQTP